MDAGELRDIPDVHARTPCFRFAQLHRLDWQSFPLLLEFWWGDLNSWGQLQPPAIPKRFQGLFDPDGAIRVRNTVLWVGAALSREEHTMANPQTVSPLTKN